MPGKEDTYATSMSCDIIPPNNQFSYHWALIVGPKVEVDKTGAMVEGTRYHAKERNHG